MLRTLAVNSVIVLSALVFCSVAFGSGSSGITYQGRILKPDGAPLAGANVQFRLQIRTPNANNCLMYEEVQALDMRNSSGQFSLTINDGSGSRMDTTGLGLDRIFENRGSFTFPAATCQSGTAYTPTDGDGRNLVVLFKDETMATWEPIPASKINYVPYAFSAQSVQGFGADSLLRVVDAGGDPLTGLAPLSNAQYTALMDLLNGSSAQYTRAGQLNGKALPTMASGEVLGWNGTTWVSTASTPGTNSVTTTMIQNGAVSGTKLDPAISISTSGTIASAITTTRDFKIYNATNQYVEMVANNAITGTTDVDGHVFYKLTWPAGAASTNGQVLTSDTSGNLTWTTPSSAGITDLSGDVTATGPGSAAATVASVGTSTAANIHSAEVLANAATAANTANMIVKRDGAGGFAAGAVSATSVSSTGAVSGASVAATGAVTAATVTATGSVTQGSSVFNDSTLPTPNTVTVQAPASVSSSYILKWPTSAGGSDEVLKTDASGNLSWSALPTALPPNGSAGGDLTGTYPNPTIAANAVTTSKINDGAVTTLKLGDKSVTYAKIQDVTTGKLLGRSTAGPGSAEELSIGSGLSLSGGTLSSTNVSSQWTTHGSDISYDGAGSVGIGTTAPLTKLEVAGSLRVGDGSETCDASITGAIRYNGGNLQFCAGAMPWTTLGVAGSGISSLTGDVTATGPGAAATTVASVGGSTAAQVHAAEVLANAATAANTADTIVKRDGTGGFAAGAVSATSVSSSGAISATGAINGASVTATGAINGASVTATGAVTGASVKTSSLQLDNGVSLIELVNPSLSAAYTLTLPSGTGATGQILTTNGLGVTSWSSLPTALPPNGSAGGDLTGTYPNPTIAANAVVTSKINDAAVTTSKIDDAAVTTSKIDDAAVTTPKINDAAVTTPKLADGSVTSVKLGDKSVTYAKIQDVTTGKLLGRSTAGPGSAEELSIGSGLSLSGGTLSSTNVSSQWTTHGSDISYDGAGNVGIGTTAPSALLDVAGAIRIAGSGSETCDATHYVGGIRYNGGNIQYCDSTSWKTLGVAGAGLTALTGDVTASGTGSVAATVASVGGVTAANVALGANAANAATDANAPSTIVKRDASGGFAAGAISGASATFTGSVTQGSSVYKDTGSNTVTVQAPPNVTSSYILKWPVSAGGNNDVLKTDASGNLSWSALPTALPPTGTAGGDLSGTYPSPSVATVGTSTAANIHSAELLANAATDANTSNAIVKRDGTGNFTANVATLNGVALYNAGSIVNLVNPPGAAYTLTLPTGPGTGGQVLSTNGSGVTSWTTAVTSATGFVQGGNTFGVNADLGTNDAYDLNLRTGGTTKMTVTSTGNVGIGTTSPTKLLEVSQSGSSFGAPAIIGFTNSAAGNASSIALSQSEFISTANGRRLIAQSYSGIELRGSRQSSGYMTPPPGTGTDASVTVYGASGDTPDAFRVVNNAGSSTLMTVSGAGNVGIGTTAPGALFQVGNPATSLGTMRLAGNTSGYVQLQPSAAAGSWTMTLPPNAGTSGYVLQTNGSGVTSWVAQSTGGTVAGADTEVQFNNAGSFGSSPKMTFAATTGRLTLNPVATSYTSIDQYGVHAIETSSGGWFRADRGSTNPTIGQKIGSFEFYNMFGSSSMTGIATENFDGLGKAGSAIAFTTTLNGGGSTTLERMRIDHNGNVGIGTTAPGSRLEVKSPAASSAPFKIVSSDGDDLFSIYEGSGTGGYFILRNGSATQKVRLDANGDSFLAGGNVGIGMTTPAYAVDVAGDVNVTGSFKVNGVNIATGGGDFKKDGSVPMTGAFKASDGTGAAPSITFNSDPDTGLYSYTGNAIGVAVGGAVRMRFTSGGMISETGGAFAVTNGFSAANPTYSFVNDNDTGLFHAATDSVAVSTGGTERMRVNATGGVGIGTSAPNGKLDVKGSIVMSGATSGYAGFQPAAAAGSTIWTLPSADGTSGQVLTTNGSGLLSWDTPSGGGAKVLADLTDVTNSSVQSVANMFLGASTGSSLTTGASNTALGYNAGSAITTGTDNTIVGAQYWGGTGPTTHSGTTAIGANTLYSGVDGDGNTVVGAGAGDGNDATIGEANTYVGSGAGGDAHFRHTYNVGIGADALHDSSADVTIAVGPSAGAHGGGWHGIHIGHQAGYDAYGDENIFIGSNVFFTNAGSSAGSQNTIIGHGSAGQNISRTASNNVMFGYKIAEDLTSGSNNTVMGYYAVPTLESGSNNIVIGMGADVPAANTSNFLNIGNTIYGDISTGNVGIGTSSPIEKLTVAGHIAPSVNGTYDLGTSSILFRDAYVKNGVTTTSDARKKTDIKNSDLGLDFINDLRPVSYHWKEGDRKLHYGVIAQETERALSQAKARSGRSGEVDNVIVSHDKKTDVYGVRYTELIAPVIKAIQELYAEFVGVKDDVDAMKAQNASQMAKLEIENQKLKQENAEMKARLDKIEETLSRMPAGR